MSLVYTDHIYVPISSSNNEFQKGEIEEEEEEEIEEIGCTIIAFVGLLDRSNY